MAIKVACRLLLLGSARGPQSSDMVVWWCWLLLRRLLLSRRPLRPEYPRTVGGGVVIEAPWLRSTSKCQRLRVPPQLNNTVCVRARACARVFGSAGAVSSGRLS
jgi:hypothetical protein